jgi:hypothetical protein
LVKDLLAKNNVTTMEHPPISPELLPDECYVFLQLRPALKRQSLCDATDIIKNATEELKRLSTNSSRNVSHNFTVTGRSEQLQKGIILKEL